MIESEKVKVLEEEKNEHIENINLFREEHEKQSNLIYNLEQELHQVTTTNTNLSGEVHRYEV